MEKLTFKELERIVNEEGERKKMKRFKICVESYLFNNSDCEEYNNYITESESIEDAKVYAKLCIDNWNKEDRQGVIYNIFSIEELEVI